MDTKLIKEYGSEILSYRMRSARNKKRAAYEDFDKQLIRLYKEERALLKQFFNRGWEPLVPPVQKGWKRLFVLRDDVARSKQADFFEAILRKINTTDYSHRKDFRVRSKRKRGRKMYVVKEQNLLKPDQDHFSKLAFTASQQQLFHPAWFSNKYQKKPVLRYVFNEPWRFVLRVKPNMIERVRKCEPELERRLQEIGRYVRGNCHDRRQIKLITGYFQDRWCDYENRRERNPFRNMSLLQILDHVKSDL
jgi:hypothetical protein